MIDTARDPLIHLDEVARRFDVCYQTVRKWVTDGNLEAIRIGHRWFTTDAAINDYARNAAQEEIDKAQATTQANQAEVFPWTRAGKAAAKTSAANRTATHAANLARYKAARNKSQTQP